MCLFTGLGLSPPEYQARIGFLHCLLCRDPTGHSVAPGSQSYPHCTTLSAQNSFFSPCGLQLVPWFPPFLSGCSLSSDISLVFLFPGPALSSLSSQASRDHHPLNPYMCRGRRVSQTSWGHSISSEPLSPTPPLSYPFTPQARLAEGALNFPFPQQGHGVISVGSACWLVFMSP